MQRSIPFLWGVVVILLVVSLTLILILNLARLMAIESLTKLEDTLDRLANEVIVYDLEINHAVPLHAVVPTKFGQTLDVDTMVELNTTIPVEIEISQTQLAGYLYQGKHDVARLKSYLAFQGGVVIETPIVTASEDMSDPASLEVINDDEITKSTSDVAVAPEITASTEGQSRPDEPDSASDPAAPQPAPEEVSSSVDTSPVESTESATEISASVSLDDEPANPGDNEETTDQIPAPANPTDTQADLLRYAEQINEIGDDIVDTAEDFGQSAEKFRAKEITLNDFRGEFSEFAPTVRGLFGEIERLSPPPEAGETHQELIDGLAKCDKAIDLMDDWLTTFDDNTKGEAVILVADCIDDVTAVEDELTELVSGN